MQIQVTMFQCRVNSYEIDYRLHAPTLIDIIQSWVTDSITTWVCLRLLFIFPQYKPLFRDDFWLLFPGAFSKSKTRDDE